MKSSKSSELDVAQLMEILCGIQKEQYPFQRYVALFTFCAWLAWPTDSKVAALAKTVAAARVIAEISQSRLKVPKERRLDVIDQISAKAFTTVEAAKALADPYVDTRFHTGFDIVRQHLWDVGAIVAFFVKCPIEMKPSLNKALSLLTKAVLRTR
jgi:hypothetical protein